MDNNKIIVMVDNTFSLVIKFSNDTYSVSRPNNTMEPAKYEQEVQHNQWWWSMAFL
jgi:hypothetical protein